MKYYFESLARHNLHSLLRFSPVQNTTRYLTMELLNSRGIVFDVKIEIIRYILDIRQEDIRAPDGASCDANQTCTSPEFENLFSGSRRLW